MPAFKMPTGIRGDSTTPKQIESLVNCYYEAGDRGTLLSRPAVDLYLEAYGIARGQGKFDDDAYYVQADQLIKVTDDGLSVQYTLIGEIDGSADCILIESFTKLLIMVKGGKAYTYDGVTLEEITDPQYVPCNDVTFIFSRFVFVPSDGGPYFWSDLNNPASIQPKNFADAETLPDKNLAIEELKDSLIIFGAATIERHVFNTPLDTFQRQQGATKNIGYVGGKARYGETLAFIGAPINGTFSIYLYGNDLPISSKAVDEILNLYTLEQLRQVRADFWSWKGQNMVKWRLPNHDLLFYGDFSFIKTGVSGDETGNWTASFIQEFNGKLICGDRGSNKLGQLVEGHTDYGEKVESEVITFLRGEPRNNFLIKRVFGQITTGQSNDENKISLSVSEDGVHYGPQEYIPLGRKGIFNNEISWGAPIGRFDNHCSIKIRWVGDIQVPLDGITYE